MCIIMRSSFTRPYICVSSRGAVLPVRKFMYHHAEQFYPSVYLCIIMRNSFTRPSIYLNIMGSSFTRPYIYVSSCGAVLPVRIFMCHHAEQFYPSVYPFIIAEQFYPSVLLSYLPVFHPSTGRAWRKLLSTRNRSL